MITIYTDTKITIETRLDIIELLYEMFLAINQFPINIKEIERFLTKYSSTVLKNMTEEFKATLKNCNRLTV